MTTRPSPETPARGPSPQPAVAAAESRGAPPVGAWLPGVELQGGFAPPLAGVPALDPATLTPTASQAGSSQQKRQYPNQRRVSLVAFDTTTSDDEEDDDAALRGTATTQQRSPMDLSISLCARVVLDEDTGALSRVNDIDVFERIGAGAYGTVYTAECPRYDCVLAVKALPRCKVVHSPSGVRFGSQTGMVPLVREADLMARLKHENVVRIFEVIDDAAHDKVFLVMEYVDGVQAGHVSEGADGNGAVDEFKCDVLSESDQLHVARGVASALQYCQQQKVVHGDVKPENVLLEHEPRVAGSSADVPRTTVRAKLADFGVAIAMQGGAFRFPELQTPASMRGGGGGGGMSPHSYMLRFGDSLALSLSGNATSAAAAAGAAPGPGPLAFSPPAGGGPLSAASPAAVNDWVPLLGGAPVSTAADATPPAGRSRSRTAGGSSGRGDHSAMSGASLVQFMASVMGPPANGSAAWAVPTPFASGDLAASIRGGDAPGPSQPHWQPLAPPEEPNRDASPRRVSEGRGPLAQFEPEPEPATPVRRSRRRTRPRGTPAFLAPELVGPEASHPTPATDAWALGVTLFGLRYGHLPFFGATREALNAAITDDEPRFPAMTAMPGTEGWKAERRWRAILRALLHKDPAQRLTTRDLLRTALLRGHATGCDTPVAESP